MSAVQASGRFDPAEWKQSRRSGRERGCWTYIAAPQLEAAGISLDGPAPLYRVSQSDSTTKGKGRFFVNVKEQP